MLITKTFHFDMAHMLDGHDGKCKNLHGHTYSLKVGLKGDLIQTGSNKGMVMDYGDIKDVVAKHILSKMDHAFIFDINSEFETDIANILIKNNQKVYSLKKRTTAENLSKYIYKILKQEISEVLFVEIGETSSSSAQYGGYYD